MRTLRILILILALSIVASATFPGRNGRIAFVQDNNIYTINPDGTDMRQLTTFDGSTGVANWPSWSADGRSIVFNAFLAPDFLGQVWVMNADGSNQHPVLAQPDFSNERPSFLPDGSQVVFSHCSTTMDETCGVYRVGVHGAGLTQITPLTLGITDRGAVYSTDGRSIAIQTGGRDGLASTVDVLRSDGSHLRPLTPAAIIASRPSWSPDGNRIAFETHCCNPENQEIWVVDRDGDDLRALTHNGHDYFAGPHDFDPSWSPDGNFIVFQRDAPDFSSAGLWILSIDGHFARQIATLRNTPVTRPSFKTNLSGNHRHRLVEIESGGALPRWGAQPR